MLGLFLHWHTGIWLCFFINQVEVDLFLWPRCVCPRLATVPQILLCFMENIITCRFEQGLAVYSAALKIQASAFRCRGFITASTLQIMSRGSFFVHKRGNDHALFFQLSIAQALNVRDFYQMDVILIRNVMYFPPHYKFYATSATGEAVNMLSFSFLVSVYNLSGWIWI